jgi:hypothetical protein
MPYEAIPLSASELDGEKYEALETAANSTLLSLLSRTRGSKNLLRVDLFTFHSRRQAKKWGQERIAKETSGCATGLDARFDDTVVG